MEKEEILFSIKHIFLPQKLPNKIDQNDESIFLKIISRAFKYFNALINETNAQSIYFDEISRMIKTWAKVQKSIHLDKDSIFREINSLNINQAFPLYLRAQNSCLLIEILSNEQNFPVVFSTFKALLSNEEVLSTTGSIYANFPSHSFYLPNKNVINSECFSELLEEMGNNVIHSNTNNGDTNITTQDATNVVKKGTFEIRDVPIDKFASEWMTILLAVDDVPMSNYPKKITKKIRDEVLWKKTIMPFRRSGNKTLMLIISLKSCIHLNTSAVT